MNYEEEFTTAVEAVRSASSVCRSVQSGLDPASLEKEDRSPVTVADFGSQAVVCRALLERFPSDPVIAEEDSQMLQAPEHHELLEKVVAEVGRVAPKADRDAVCRWIDRGNASAYSDRFWTLDPIDGTKGFLRGDHYAVALALLVDGEIRVAALACPNLSFAARGNGPRGVVFAAHRGEGAYRIPLSGEPVRERIGVSHVARGAEARFCESVESAHSSHDDAADVAARLGIKKAPYRIDSQAKYGVVARGDADIYLRLTTHTGYVEKIWDHAAGTLVIEEAGGRVTDLRGRTLDYTQGVLLARNAGIVATNGHLHEDVLQALDAVLAS
ncbi:MAG: 3'(2'),5'-bisphosphate nucleotidase [Rhodothermales bacterium]